MIAASHPAARIGPLTPRHDPAHTIAAFVDAMVTAGMRPLDPIGPKLAGGGLIRFRCEGDGPGRQNGRAVLHLDRCPAGWFRHMRLGVEGRWRADAPAVRLTSAERVSRERARCIETSARANAKLAGQEQAASRCETLWRGAKPDCEAHPYLAAKRLNPPGLRAHRDTLLVPMRDVQGRLWNVQRISPDAAKRFTSGARVDGLAWGAEWKVYGQSTGTLSVPGKLSSSTVLAIGEGMATMAAVHAATGLPVRAAMSLANLAPLARIIRTEYGPDATLILCADMDVHRPDNPGLAAANAAARAVGGLVARPPRPPGWPDGQSWDFADTWAAPDGEALIRVALTLGHGGAA